MAAKAANAANAGRTPAPPNLKIIAGRGSGLDTGGRPLPVTPEFSRRVPAKPDDLSDDASDVWDVIVAQLDAVQLLKPLDGPSLQVACETWARWKGAVRMRQEQGIIGENSQGRVAAPYVGIEERAARDFRAWCAEFGLTPAAEGKLNAGEQGDREDNPFEG